jgi:hypothetical protein
MAEKALFAVTLALMAAMIGCRYYDCVYLLLDPGQIYSEIHRAGARSPRSAIFDRSCPGILG